MKRPIFTISELKIEFLTWLVSISLLVFVLRNSLIYGTHIPTHDNYYWAFPIFHYFASCLSHFQFPLWNPYSHAGEPFYFSLAQIRLLEPLGFIAVFLAKLLSWDTAQAFTLNRLLQSIWMLFGVYLVFRPYANSLRVRLVLIPVLLFSSFFFSSFRQDGLINQFLWAPFLFYFFKKIFLEGKHEFKYFLALAATFGINFTSYFFSGPAIFLLALFSALFIFRRIQFLQTLRRKGFLLKCFFSAWILFLMAGPSIIMFLESRNYLYPGRTALQNVTLSLSYQLDEDRFIHPNQGLSLDIKSVKANGTFTSIWDYLLAIDLPANQMTDANRLKGSGVGAPSESIFYFGILVWIIGLIGIFYGHDKEKLIWSFVLGFFFFLNLGPMTGLLQLLRFIFPPIWVLRHTHALALYTHFSYLYFFVLGLNYLEETNYLSKHLRNISFKFSAASIMASLGYFILILAFVIFLLAYPEVNWGIFWIALLALLAGSWLIYRFTEKWLFVIVGLLSAQLFLNLFHKNSFNEFLAEIFVFFIVPLIVTCVLIRKKNSAQHFTAIPIYAAIVLNLISATYYFRGLYEGSQSPRGLDSKINLDFPEFTFPITRFAAPIFVAPNQFQGIRYPELLDGKAYAFSNLDIRDESYIRDYLSRQPDLFAFALRAKHWNDFMFSKQYFSTLQKDIGSPSLKTIFAVDQPTLKFRESYLSLESNSWSTLLDSIEGPEKVFASTIVIEPSELDKIPATMDKYNRNKRYSEPIRLVVDNFQFSPNRISLQVDSPQAGFLYWADSFHPYWKAMLNDQTVPIIRANGNFKAVVLQKGLNKIEMEFDPLLLKVSLAVFYFVFVSVFFFYFASRFTFRNQENISTKSA